MPRKNTRRRSRESLPASTPDLQFNELDSRFLEALREFNRRAETLAASGELGIDVHGGGQSETELESSRVVRLKHAQDKETGNLYRLTHTLLLEVIAEAFGAGIGLVAEVWAEAHGESRERFETKTNFIEFLRKLTEAASRDRRTMRGKKVSREQRELYIEMETVLREQRERGEEENIEQASRVMKKRHSWTEQRRKSFARSFAKNRPRNGW